MIRKALIAAALALAGCAQVPMADPQADQSAKAFPPPTPGKGALYVYRTGYMGVARSIDVQVVGGSTAQLGANTYLRLEGPPGPIEVDCKIGDKTGAGQVLIEDGQTRFVEVSMTVLSLMPGCQVAAVPPDRGQVAVGRSQRVTVQ